MPVASQEEVYGYILFIGTSVAYWVYFAFADNALFPIGTYLRTKEIYLDLC